MSDPVLFDVRRGYLRPRPRVRFYNELGGVFDLTGSAVTVKFATRDRGLLWEGHPGTVVDPPTDGYAEYAWAVGETDIEHGDYLLIFEATPPDGLTVPLPVANEIVVRVHKDFV